jgi:hypothetical protein
LILASRASALVAVGLCLAQAAAAIENVPAARETGWSPQGLPLFDYDSDTGFGYGLRLLLIDHGTGDERPYRYALTAQFYQTTGGNGSHFLSLDAPHLFGSRYRLELEAGWDLAKYFPYYGIGNSSVYQEQFVSCTGGCSPAFKGAHYYQYDQQTLPRFKLNLRRDLGGAWQLFGGYRFRLTRIAALYGADGTSQLIADAQSRKLVGFDGSNPEQPFRLRTAELTSGLVYDTRDNEPAPTDGMFHEVSLRGGLRAFGGQFDYWGANLTLRFYHWLIPGSRRLVFASRGLIDVAGGDVPFFLLGTTGGLSGPDGVGGENSVRGLLGYRLQGNVKLLLNNELRWRFWSVPYVEVGAVAGLDAGRVWSGIGAGDRGPVRFGASLGLRLAWNKNFVIRYDYGIAISEPYANGSQYLTFDELF